MVQISADDIGKCFPQNPVTDIEKCSKDSQPVKVAIFGATGVATGGLLMPTHTQSHSWPFREARIGSSLYTLSSIS